MDFNLVAKNFDVLEIAPPSKLVLLEAQTLASAHVPSYPPDTPVLFINIDSRQLASHLKTVLLTTYPKEHVVFLVGAGEKKEVQLLELSDHEYSESVSVYVPPLGEGTSFESFAEIVAHLRAPNGCPWDREQTHESLRKHLLEESYEVYDALEAGATPALAGELGDLWLQIVLHAQLAAEAGVFDLTDVQAAIASKIVRRHPHVFGDAVAQTASDVNRQWERIKAAEREQADGTAGT